MFVPYPDIDKELCFDTDYMPITDKINTFPLHDIPDIIENLSQALENACIYHAELLEIALYSDIAALKKWYVIRLVSCTSSGTIASYIGNNAYKMIDKAVNNTIVYLSDMASEEQLYNIDTDPHGIKSIIVQCYNMDITKE